MVFAVLDDDALRKVVSRIMPACTVLSMLDDAVTAYRARHLQPPPPAAAALARISEIAARPSPATIARLAGWRPPRRNGQPMQWPDKLGARRGWCSFCRWTRRQPNTHLVKWPAGWVDNGTSGPKAVRSFVCAQHASKIVDYQRSIGVPARAYRYRQLP